MKADLISQLRALDTSINAICSVTGAPGLSLGVAQNGKIIHSAHFGFRDVEKQVVADSNTIYGVASLSKSFTASAIGILVSENRLSWTTPVKDIITDLSSQNPMVTELLTVTDLLCHNTGLASSNHWWYGADGELLLERDQTVPSFNALKPLNEFRVKYGYSNWNYCLVGRIIEILSGKSYSDFVYDRILRPLKLENTSCTHDDAAPNLAKPYAVLEDRSPYLLPFPKAQADTFMAPAQAIRSTVNDMLTYASALLEVQKKELGSLSRPSSANPLKYVAKQLSGHISKGSATLLESSYGLGMSRFQLPQSIGGIGCNAMFVKEMPTITPGPRGGLVLIQTGSIAGYTSFLALLPEYDTAIFVAVNAIGLGDPAGWVTELLIETIVESPDSTDFVALAKESANGHANRERVNQCALDAKQEHGTHPRSLESYLGSYVGFAEQFELQIRLHKDQKLQVAFQGRDSQVWDLVHYHYDTFTWLVPFDEQAKRARFNFAGPDLFKLIFKEGKDREIDRVCWIQEPGLSEDEQCFLKRGTGLKIQF